MSEHASEPADGTSPSDATPTAEPLPTTPDPALVNIMERGIPPREHRGSDD